MIKKSINATQIVLILGGTLVKTLEIYVKSKGLVLLLLEQDWLTLKRNTRFDEALF